MAKIYCAGPLFNDKEKEEMKEIATVLERNGYHVFLPQRDGFEFVNLFPAFTQLGISEDTARRILNKAIFSLDVFQVVYCQGLVLNMNGRVPDEGAMVEAGIAWSCGKQIVIYKNDARTLLNGNDNPLILGLSDFKLIRSIEEIPRAFHDITDKNNKPIDAMALNKSYLQGEKIASLADMKLDEIKICQKLLEVLEENDVLCQL
ncbi:MAG: nucleoside 2-deoxyribosyltransferase [Spirochaetales bacterium]|nr:nucleoside 2-deoxyribosyltransferase [Spirochaetales bacterium]